MSYSDLTNRRIQQEHNNDEESMMTEEEINFAMKKFINYEILVDGGLKISAIIKTASDKNIRYIAVKKSVKSVWQGKHPREIPVHISQRARIWPFTIERYLLSLIHFYNFFICKEIERDWVSSEQILPMKVLINTLFFSFNIEKLNTFVSWTKKNWSNVVLEKFNLICV